MTGPQDPISVSYGPLPLHHHQSSVRLSNKPYMKPIPLLLPPLHYSNQAHSTIHITPYTKNVQIFIDVYVWPFSATPLTPSRTHTTAVTNFSGRYAQQCDPCHPDQYINNPGAQDGSIVGSARLFTTVTPWKHTPEPGFSNTSPGNA